MTVLPCAGVVVLLVSDSVSVTGQMVVVKGMMEVTTVVDSAGQFVTVVAHWVMVTSEVV